MAWLNLSGESERSFAVAGTEQFTVQVAVPADAPPGPYAFRLEMVGVENPDEDFSSGPSVSFDVPAPVAAQPLPWRRIVPAIALLVVIGVAVLLFRPQGVTVPNLRRLTVNEAANRLAGKGLTVGNVLEGEGAGVSAGRVITTQPGPGSQVSRNSSVNLVIAPAGGGASPGSTNPRLEVTRVVPRLEPAVTRAVPRSP